MPDKKNLAKDIQTLTINTNSVDNCGTIIGGITDQKNIQHWICGCKVNMTNGELIKICDECTEKGITKKGNK